MTACIRGNTEATTVLLLLVALLTVWAPPAASQSGDGPGPRSAAAVRTERPPLLDGRPDEPVWQRTPVIAEFVQHEPREGAPVSQRTEVRLLYDDEALYVGAWLWHDDPAAIVTGEARRDANLSDADAILVVLDTYRDAQNAFVFGTTPAGIEYDGQVTKQGDGGGRGRVRQQTGSGGGFNLNWDGTWAVATSRDEHGWYAEFRIPFATLRYTGSGPQRWGLNLARYIRRHNEQAFWSPVPRQHSLYRLSEAGILDGLVAPARRAITVTPYLLASVSRDYLGDSLAHLQDIGADAKVGLTSSLALDLTYNTDFAQVEVDEQQVNLTRFNLFFPEKRPFFLENAGLFAVGTPQVVELFFSRRIGITDDGAQVPLVGGARLTGKLAGLSIGLLDIQSDRVPGVVEPNNYAVVRVSRELPSRSRLGAVFINRATTSRSGDYNRTYGVDGRLGIGDPVTIDAYAARTDTSGRAGREHAYHVSAGYTTRDWRASATVTEVGEHFNPEVGFLERSGYRFFQGFVLRHLRTPRIPWLREFRPHVSYRGWFDFAGFTETRIIHLDSHVEFANGAFYSPAFNLTREGLQQPFEIAAGVVVPPGTYDNVEAAWRFNTNESAPVSLNGGLDVGGFLSGRRTGVSGTISGRHGSTMAAALRINYQDVDLPQGSFRTTVLGLRLAYSFSPRAYLQSLVQYNSQGENWSGNVRFGWLNDAGTGLFVVYNELQRTGGPAGPVHRALIAKYSRQLTVR